MSSDHADDAAARTDIACRNCGTPAPLNFCAECGQDTAPHAPSLWEFAHEFVGHYVAFEGRLWQTLLMLLARPGRLTREYLAGRKVRYVLPLRLYLTASFIFFVALKLLGTGLHVTNQTPPGADLPAVAIGTSHGAKAEPLTPADRERIVQATSCPPGGQLCLAIGRALNKLVSLDKSPDAMNDEGSHLLALAPYAVFVLLPVYAVMLKLLYFRRHRLYGEHLVFALHMHAYWFIAMLLGLVLPKSGGDAVAVVVGIQGVMALRTVYGGSWIGAVLRALLLTVVYGVLIALVTAALAFYVLAA